MRHSHSFRAAIVLSLALSVAAFADPSHPVGKPSGGGPVIEWQISVTGQERIQLTVMSPDGETFSKEFTPGRNPMFRLGDLDSAPDGQYTFELRVVPRISSDVKKKLADAREAQDDALVRKIQRAAGIDHQLTESGGFTVLNGSIVSPDAIEADANHSTATRAVSTDAQVPGRPSFKTTTDDQVIADDLIVQGSACIGLDCVANESFGFDTIRLKENNTRIAFDDTSSTSGFPSNDWQLVANDSASGGQSLFAIFDQTAGRNIVVAEAAAPTNALYVDSTGNIGMQTAAPGLDFHMVETDTPAIRLEQTSGGGFTAQTWDIGANEANFFVRDVTGGSRLPFRIRPGAPTSSIDISAIGNVGVGTASPATKMDIFTGSNSTGLRLRGLTDAVEIGDLFMSNTGSLVLSTVNGTGTQSFVELRPEDDQYGLVLRNSSGASAAQFANFYVTDAADDYLTIDMNSAKTGDFTLTASGFVGVGTVTPSSKLHVNGGDIRVSGGSFIDDGTTLSVPDYVFDNSYELMSLPEVAAFVRQNRHLPEVPAEAEVKAKGLNMSDFQMRLLRKVEELTLYAIDQHEQAASLSAAKTEQQKVIADLQAENAEMRARLARIEQALAAQKQ